MSAVQVKNIEGRRIVSSIGMMVLLVSFTMLFATLLLGYILFRLTNDVWPPMGMQRVPLTFPFISTVIIGLSSYFFFSFEKAFFAKEKKKMLINFLVTFALGCLFMVVQFKLWASMKLLGLYVEGGVFPSLMYSLTWVHAAHIVAALLSLLFLVPVLKSGYREDRELWVQNIGKFWHFLGIIWFLMFIIMFVF